MSKNNKPSPPSRPKREQDSYQVKFITGVTDGYQPATDKLSPVKPPSNPPNKKSSGKK